MNTHTFGMLECEVRNGDEWYFHGNEVVVRDSSGKGVILVGRCDCDHDKANANRIVACVNACAGMADPASEIAALKAQRDELLEACKSAIAGFKGVDAGLGKSVVAITGVYRMLLATIAKAEGGAA